MKEKEDIQFLQLFWTLILQTSDFFEENSSI